VVTYLTHYYVRGTEPFQSLSALSDAEAVRIMAGLYDETLFGVRFRDPAQYLQHRRRTEQWVRDEFIAKGGRPQADYPIPMVLGDSKWLVKQAPIPEAHAEIRIPLSAFTNYDVSFTYPDSMVSLWLSREKPVEYYLPGYHGKIFTLSEILAIVEEKGLPEDAWKTDLPAYLAPYIEAQVWNHAPLLEYKKRVYDGNPGE
jgi:hypothetical protein